MSKDLEASPDSNNKAVWIAVTVAGLGYFVDVFDMWLFANFRVASLTEMGLTPEEVTSVGIYLLNWQQAGFLIGGFIWGILGDKRGRTSVMFGSIFLYSVATFLNGYVQTPTQYAALRFITGIGLAGEIGAGITLVAEILPRLKRGYGTTFVTCLGVAGAIGAALAGKYLHWKDAYRLGGIMGFLLLLLRILVHESGMFHQMRSISGVKQGSLLHLFGSLSRTIRYLSCIIVGIPIYLFFGILVAFSPEIALSIGITEKVQVPDIMIWASIGITAGDLLAGVLSQWLQSRRLPIFISLVLSLLLSLPVSLGLVRTATQYGYLAGLISLFTGYWACLITTAAEQFGTNIRATVTTTVPNLIRGSAIILTLSFGYLKGLGLDAANALLTVTLFTYLLAFLALKSLTETFHKDLNYVE